MTLSISISPSSANVTAGNSATFSVSVSGGTSPYSYLWYLNGNSTGITSSSYTFSLSEYMVGSESEFSVYCSVSDSSSPVETGDSATSSLYLFGTVLMYSGESYTDFSEILAHGLSDSLTVIENVNYRLATTVIDLVSLNEAVNKLITDVTSESITLEDVLNFSETLYNFEGISLSESSSLTAILESIDVLSDLVESCNSHFL